MLRIALITVAALTLTTAVEARQCSMSKASGLGVSKDIAMFMSNKAVHNMIVKNGETGVGKVTTTCDSSGIVTTTCTSMQRSCK